MSDSLSCNEVREVAPEIALGILGAEERAQVLAHLSRCHECRELVAQLTELADDLLLLAPSREPAVGFESRLEERLRATPVRRRWPRRVALGLAAASLAVLAGASVYAVTREDRRLATAYRETLREAGGKYLEAAALLDSAGRRVGEVFVYAGSPSWVFVAMDPSVEPGPHLLELVTEQGTVVDTGPITLLGAAPSGGRAILVDLRDIALVRVRTPASAEVIEGNLKED